MLKTQVTVSLTRWDFHADKRVALNVLLEAAIGIVAFRTPFVRFVGIHELANRDSHGRRLLSVGTGSWYLT